MNTMLRTVAMAGLRRRRETDAARAILVVRWSGEFAGGQLAGAEDTPRGLPEGARAIAAGRAGFAGVMDFYGMGLSLAKSPWNRG